MERKNGILQVRMRTNGGPFKWSFQAHQALAEAWSVIGHDPENEVLILTSTDPYWIGEFDLESFREIEADQMRIIVTTSTYYDATKIVENFVYDIDIPTIGAINGPGLHGSGLAVRYHPLHAGLRGPGRPFRGWDGAG